MLVPLQQVVGTGYNAGLTATAFTVQPDYYVGAGYTSPSGRPIGGLKVGRDVIAAQALANNRARYTQGPLALGAASEAGYVAKDQTAQYLTEAEQMARSAVAQVKTGWDDPKCRPTVIAALVLGYLLFAR